MPVYIWAVIENPYNLFGGMPSFAAIENPENDLSSEVISSDGVSLGRYFRYNRSQIQYDELSRDLVNTLLLSEDHRFYEHAGMDLWAYFRVLAGIITLQPQGGGSTITQQTAKNLFRTRGNELQGKLGSASPTLDLVISKTKEWIIAIRLEHNLTKEEIIALYLNTVSFNNNAYGIKVASETYFSKAPKDLTIPESALLIGMLQGTTLFNPLAYPERARMKRNQVIEKLFRHKYITSRTKIDSLKNSPLELRLNIQSHHDGLAQHFRNVLLNELMPWCQDNGFDLFESGLKIYTSIDSRLQRFAEEAVRSHMAAVQRDFDNDWGKRNPWRDESGNELRDFVKRKIKKSDYYQFLQRRFENQPDSVEWYLQQKRPMRIFSWKGERDTLFNAYDSVRYYNRFLQAGLVAIDPRIGAVRAWVGGIDFAHFQFDHVKQSARQPGSTFKPFVYGKALEEGYSQCQRFQDIAPSLTINGQVYRARNANGSYGEGAFFTLRQAMARSLNSITMQLMAQLNATNVRDFAIRQGIVSKLEAVPALALGTSEVSLLELVGAYTTFANKGVHTKPIYLSRIEDKHGNILAAFSPQTKQGTDEITAYKIIHLLKGSVEEEGGTSRMLSEFVKNDNEIASKTGTTDNGSDGWFVGMTPTLVTGVWVGGDERSIHFPSWGEGSGGKTALPIWDKFMTQVYRHPVTGYRKGFFEIPDQDLQLNLDCTQQADSVLTTRDF